MKIINYALAVLFVYCILTSCSTSDNEALQALEFEGITDVALAPGGAERFACSRRENLGYPDSAREFKGVKNGRSVRGVVCEYSNGNFESVFKVELK